MRYVLVNPYTGRRICGDGVAIKRKLPGLYESLSNEKEDLA